MTIAISLALAFLLLIVFVIILFWMMPKEKSLFIGKMIENWIKAYRK